MSEDLNRAVAIEIFGWPEVQAKSARLYDRDGNAMLQVLDKMRELGLLVEMSVYPPVFPEEVAFFVSVVRSGYTLSMSQAPTLPEAVARACLEAVRAQEEAR